MFKKTFRLHVRSSVAMTMVKVLGKYGIKFEVTDEYITRFDENRIWYRDFVVHTTKRKMAKIRKEFRTIANR